MAAEDSFFFFQVKEKPGKLISSSYRQKITLLLSNRP